DRGPQARPDRVPLDRGSVEDYLRRDERRGRGLEGGRNFTSSRGSRAATRPAEPAEDAGGAGQARAGGGDCPGQRGGRGGAGGPVTLEPAGRIVLDSGGAGEEPALGVADFGFDGAGRIGFISTEKQDPFELTFLDPAGGPTQRVLLGFAHEEKLQFPTAAWM